MNEIVKNVIINHLGNNGEYVFVNKDKNKYSGSFITHWFSKIVKKAEIKDFRFHDLRHTFASRLAMKTGNLQAIKELLGHKDYRMTLRYSHLTPEYKKELVEILEDDIKLGKNMAKEEKIKKQKIVKILVRQ